MTYLPVKGRPGVRLRGRGEGDGQAGDGAALPRVGRRRPHHGPHRRAEGGPARFPRAQEGRAGERLQGRGRTLQSVRGKKTEAQNISSKIIQI